MNFQGFSDTEYQVRA